MIGSLNLLCNCLGLSFYGRGKSKVREKLKIKPAIYSTIILRQTIHKDFGVLLRNVLIKVTTFITNIC